MKRNVYQRPAFQVLHLCTEGVIATSTGSDSNLKVDKDDNVDEADKSNSRTSFTSSDWDE